MPTEANAKKIWWRLLFGLLTIGFLMAGSFPVEAFTGYYNLLGTEGIPTLAGTTLAGDFNGPAPPVGDYFFTNCRYIDQPDRMTRSNALRYPLRLPNGVTITKISAFLADFDPSGVLLVYLRYRPWNSRQGGVILGNAQTDNSSESDKTINITGLDVVVNNQTNEYWIDVIPRGFANPGQLCVYGIQVTYTAAGVALPLVIK